MAQGRPHALRRVSSRVRQGGHNIPTPHVLRRYERSLRNFREVYIGLANSYVLYDNFFRSPIMVEEGRNA